MSGDKLFYMHKSQASKEIPNDVYEQALDVLNDYFPNYTFNCLMYNPKKNIVRFDNSEDFDSCTEPCVQGRVIVDLNTMTAKEGKVGKDVWHGKGNFWVDDDYSGFNPKHEQEWRSRYMDRIKERPQFGKHPHGESRASWLSHLIDLDLIDEYFERNNIANPIEYLERHSTGKFGNGMLVRKYEEYKENN